MATDLACPASLKTSANLLASPHEARASQNPINRGVIDDMHGNLPAALATVDLAANEETGINRRWSRGAD